MKHSTTEACREFRTPNDVTRFWHEVREVPRRTEGRTPKQYERYYLGLYLVALADHDLLSYPLQVREGDSPDFMVTWESGETSGLEVTRATDEELQETITRNEKEHPEGYAILASASGYVRDRLEGQWCDFFQKAIEKKVAKLSGYRPASRYDLLISDDTRMGAGNRRKVLAILTPWVSDLKRKTPKLGKISLVASLDVLYDIGGDSRIFPYIEWSVPKLDEASKAEDSYRIQHAGREVVAGQIRTNKMTNSPIYSIDYKGRLVKETSDGRRFQVRVNEDGEEITIQELTRR